MKQFRCPGCRQYFDMDKGIALGLSRFCSWDCAYSKRKTKPPTKQPEVLPYNREQVLADDGWRCRMCGSSSALHVHHVKYRSEGIDNSPLNLITLCSKDHGLVHSDKERYQPLCRGVIWLRSVYGDRATLIPMLEDRDLSRFFWLRPRKDEE